jgi:hypothetical protein
LSAASARSSGVWSALASERSGNTLSMFHVRGCSQNVMHVGWSFH